MGTVSNRQSALRRNFFLLFILFLWVVVVGFTMFEYRRERGFKAELLDASLQQINTSVADKLDEGIPPDSVYARLSVAHPSLRLTIVDHSGRVIYDSYSPADSISFDDHLTRPEIDAALRTGHGFTVRRASSTTRDEYFYSAMDTGFCVVRSALPYSLSVDSSLSVGHSFMWFVAFVTFLISLVGAMMIRRMRLADEQIESEHRRAMFEQSEKIRIKKQLTNNINHELKTPVSAIKGCLETIVANPDMSDEQRNMFVGKCYEQTERLRRLLDDISTITRLDEAKEMITFSTLSLRDIIDEAVSDSQADTTLMPMRIGLCNFGDNRFEMQGNARLLGLIFRNLIDNARAYSGGRDICIAFEGEFTADSHREYRFRFADNGIGVEPEHLPHLFERFYRVDSGRSRKLGGTGLGLSIVKNAVVLHGGSIEVTNTESGGLEFHFSLQAD